MSIFRIVKKWTNAALGIFLFSLLILSNEGFSRSTDCFRLELSSRLGFPIFSELSQDDLETLVKAELTLGRPLTHYEKNLVLQAHHTGTIKIVNGEEIYSPEDNRAKARVLYSRPGLGFDPKSGEVRKLMEERVVGRFTDNPLTDLTSGDEVMFLDQSGTLRFGKFRETKNSKIYLSPPGPEKSKLFGLFGADKGVSTQEIVSNSVVRAGDEVTFTSLSGKHYSGQFVQTLESPKGGYLIGIRDPVSRALNFYSLDKIDMKTIQPSDVVGPGDYFKGVLNNGYVHLGRLKQRIAMNLYFTDYRTGREMMLSATAFDRRSIRRSNEDELDAIIRKQRNDDYDAQEKAKWEARPEVQKKKAEEEAAHLERQRIEDERLLRLKKVTLARAQAEESTRLARSTQNKADQAYLLTDEKNYENLATLNFYNSLSRTLTAEELLEVKTALKSLRMKYALDRFTQYGAFTPESPLTIRK